MKKKDIVRAWRDAEFRAGLSEEERAQLGNPAGEIEITDQDLRNEISGGAISSPRPVFCRDITTCH